MAKPLKTLRKQFLQQGLHLLFSFDTSIAPGVIIERRRARDVNRKGSIDKFKGVKLKVLGPADVGLMEFSRVHELDAGAGAELIGGAAVSSRLKRTRTVKLSLGNPVKFFIDDLLPNLESVAQDAPDVLRFQMIADERLRPYAPTDRARHAWADDWAAMEPRIRRLML